MKFKYLIIACLLPAALLTGLRASKAGYLPTSEYLKLSEGEKVAYVMGMSDMMHYMAVVSDNKGEIEFIEKCFTGRNLGVLKNLFDSYLSETRDSSEYDMTSNFHDALEKKCK